MVAVRHWCGTRGATVEMAVLTGPQAQAVRSQIVEPRTLVHGHIGHCNLGSKVPAGL